MTNELITLAQWMAGSFSNQKQAQNNPQLFAHIHIIFRPLPFEFFKGIGFYSEQVYDYALWSPYRQGVHRVVPQNGEFYIENYSLKDAVRYAGAGRELDILKTITPDCITRRDRCAMIFWRDGAMFRGAVEPGNGCLIEKNGRKTYLVSDVELTEDTWVSLDKGMDVNTHEQVWGSNYGSLRFEKRQSFAEEVPRL